MRLIKQLIYGVLYLAVLILVIWAIYLFIFPKPAPTCSDGIQNQNETGIDCGGLCISCDIKNIKPLSFDSPILFGDNKFYSLDIKVYNPNENFGAKSFDFEVNFYSAANELLKTFKNNSFIYANETKNIILAGMEIANGIPARAETKINQETIDWKKSQDFSSPAYKINKVSAILDNDQITINGFFTNNNNFVISKAIVNAFLMDKNNKEIYVSRTELKNIPPSQEENFKIFFPAQKSLISTIDLEKTKVYAEVLK